MNVLKNFLKFLIFQIIQFVKLVIIAVKIVLLMVHQLALNVFRYQHIIDIQFYSLINAFVFKDGMMMEFRFNVNLVTQLVYLVLVSIKIFVKNAIKLIIIEF